MSANTDNKREHNRVQLKQTVSVSESQSSNPAEVFDISFGGIALLSDIEFPREPRFSVLFPFGPSR